MVEKDQYDVTSQEPNSHDPSLHSDRERANRNFGTNKSFFTWFDPNDGPAERRLIWKLDFFILAYAFIGFWVMYIDRGIFANAYVSGMKEELNFYGNELVQLNTLFRVGYCVSMIPATLLVSQYPAHYIVPSAMLLWGMFTLLLHRSSSFAYVAGFRFLVGFLEGPFFCSVHYVLGSWYRSDELVRRAGIFYVSSGVGTMTTGLLAARIYQSLDGALGYSGWRWMYLVSGIVTVPIAIWGFLSFPGSPSEGKRWFFTEQDIELAQERMRLEGRNKPRGMKLSASEVKRFLGAWQFWTLVPWTLAWNLGFQAQMQGAYTLWLKAQTQYSVVQVNNYTAISPSLGILFILAFSWIADKRGKGAVVPLVGGVAVVMFIARLAFVLYDKTSFSFKWFAVVVSYMQVSLSPVNYSLANLAFAGDAEGRAFIISSMLAVSTAFNAWVPLVTLPTVEAPRYFKGYVMETCMQVIYFLWTVFVIYVVRRKNKARKTGTEGAAEIEDSKA